MSPNDMAYIMEELTVALVSSAFSFIPGFVLGIVAYVLSSIGLYTLATRRGVNHAWMSWVPVLNAWIIGSLSDQYRYVVNGQIKSKRKSLLILQIIQFVIAIVMIVTCVVMLVNLFGFAINGGSEDEVLAAVMGPLVIIVAVYLPLIGVAIATVIIRYMAMYDIYKSCDPGNCVLFLILSIFISYTEPFFLFFARNKDLGMPPRKPQEPQYIEAM